MSFSEKVIKLIFGSKHERDLKALLPILHQINIKENWARSLTPEDFPLQTKQFKERLEKGESLDNMLPEAYALVREAARRNLGERSYDVQLLGGIVLHQGKIMELKTGEGKTLSSVSAAYLNALSGKGVHMVTVNDYLAERDALWMKPIYDYLGVTVGTILPNMDTETRKKNYACDITYGTNNEFGFDYLRDNMNPNPGSKAQRPHNYCIIDEIDSILIDESRTPLIISGQAEDDTHKFIQVNKYVNVLTECDKDPETGDYPEEPIGDYKLNEKNKSISFTDEGINKIESTLLKGGVISGSLFDEENFEYLHYYTQAMRAHKLFAKDTQYIVQEGKVEIVDEFTGRVLHGRRYSEGLHQAIEAKENIRVARKNRTLASITFQNYFRMYEKLSGMTGTADTEAREFSRIYGLDVVVVPTNRPVARKDEHDVIFLNEEYKMKAICDEISEVNKKGQPILVGTASIEKSELISKLLTRRGIKHEVLNAKNHAREALIIAEAGAKGSITIATNMAGRGTDIKLGGNPEFRARKKAGTDATEEEYQKCWEQEYRKWQDQYQEIKDLGGLYILGTERHESRRIDNQLRGRAGRQGDPGRSRFFISMDDDLMRLFGGENMKNLMGRLGMEGGEPIYHPWINNAIERAQSRVEERNFDIRKHLLDFDNVLNEQRTFIYGQRDKIMEDPQLVNRVMAAAEELVDDLLEEHENILKSDGQDLTVLLDALKNSFMYEPAWIRDHDFDTKNLTEVKTRILEDLKKDLEEKENLIGKENFNNLVIRIDYLRSIDKRWQEHLEALESLREAVYLRTYSQKNPLLEYKLEAFDIFDKLIFEIRTDIAKRMLKIKINKEADRSARKDQGPGLVMSHQSVNQFGAGGRLPGQQKVQIKRAMPKVGRNDPCPCGSGRKYKQCCGRNS